MLVMCFRSVMTSALFLAAACTGTPQGKTLSGDKQAGVEDVADAKNATYLTRYDDGRISEVRVLELFDYYVDPAALAEAGAPELIIVAIEWGNFDAIVGDRDAAFAQLPSNTMIGGDLETNARIREPSQAFFAAAAQIFSRNGDSLPKLVGSVPNRDTRSVSFDFVSNKGTFTVQKALADLENGTDDWAALYKQAKSLQSEIKRAHS